jgi:fucose permease
MSTTFQQVGKSVIIGRFIVSALEQRCAHGKLLQLLAVVACMVMLLT